MTSTPVVDIGCHSHPDHQGQSQDSIARLIRRFRPTSVYGFDPHPDLVEGKTRFLGGTITRTRAAAWVYDGTVAYTPREDMPLRSRIGEGDQHVRCFDLARWLAGRRVIVKMDVEGGEYQLLTHICQHGHDQNIELLLVEWHRGPPDWQERRDDLVRVLRCPVEDWEPVNA